jgi:hypothetical protein
MNVFHATDLSGEVAMINPFEDPVRVKRPWAMANELQSRNYRNKDHSL